MNEQKKKTMARTCEPTIKEARVYLGKIDISIAVKYSSRSKKSKLLLLNYIARKDGAVRRVNKFTCIIKHIIYCYSPT